MIKYLFSKFHTYFNETIYLFKKNFMSASLLIIAPLMTVIINFFWFAISGNPLFSKEIASFFTSGSLFATIITTAVTVGVSYNGDSDTHLTEVRFLSLVVIVTTLFMGFQSGYLADKSLTSHSIASYIVILLEFLGLSIVLFISMHFKATQEEGFPNYKSSVTQDNSKPYKNEINDNLPNELKFLRENNEITDGQDE